MDEIKNEYVFLSKTHYTESHNQLFAKLWKANLRHFLTELDRLYLLQVKGGIPKIFQNSSIIEIAMTDLSLSDWFDTKYNRNSREICQVTIVPDNQTENNASKSSHTLPDA